MSDKSTLGRSLATCAAKIMLTNFIFVYFCTKYCQKYRLVYWITLIVFAPSEVQQVFTLLIRRHFIVSSNDLQTVLRPDFCRVILKALQCLCRYTNLIRSTCYINKYVYNIDVAVSGRETVCNCFCSAQQSPEHNNKRLQRLQKNNKSVCYFCQRLLF